MEELVSRAMLRISKFEFYLLSRDVGLARLGADRKVIGIDYEKLAEKIEPIHEFNEFDFENSDFKIFKNEPPQFIVLREDQTLQWYSDCIAVTNWKLFFKHGYVQLRNNLAHGNKNFPAFHFTSGRTEQYLKAADALIDFVSAGILNDPDWETVLEYS